MSVRLKKRDITESRYGQGFLSRSSSRVLEQVEDQGMRDGKAVQYYWVFMLSQGNGRRDVGGGGRRVKGMITHQLQKFTPSYLVSRVTVMYFAP